MQMFPDEVKNHSTSVAVSACGNYCLVGNRGGSIFRYNLQSGLPRGSYPASASAAAMKDGLRKIRSATPGNVLHSRKQILGPVDVTSATGFLSSGLAQHENEQKPQQQQLAAQPQLSSSSVSSSAAAVSHLGWPVTGLFVDAMNEVLVSAGGDPEGRIIFWSFELQEPLGSTTAGSAVSMLTGFRDGGFVAAVCEDGSIRVYDVVTQKLSRQFRGGHGGRITGALFTPDGRRVLSCSEDGTFRVWDMLTARCLSWMAVGAPIVSMSMSPSGEFVALALEGRKGLFLFADRSLYETVHFWREPSQPSPVALAAAAADDAQGDKRRGRSGSRASSSSGSDSDGDQEGEEEAGADGQKASRDQSGVPEQQQQQQEEGVRRRAESLDQRSAGSVTLAAIPRAYWISLFNLEAIKARNKPVEPPKAPPQAPFFLPTVHKEGAGPAFPTAAELSRMASAAPVTESAADGGKKRPRGADSVPQSTAPSTKRAASSGAEFQEAGAWSDDDDDDGGAWNSAWPEEFNADEEGGSETEDAAGGAGAVVKSRILSKRIKKSGQPIRQDTHIIKRYVDKRLVFTVDVFRCKLAEYLKYAHDSDSNLDHAAIAHLKR
jgi:U3 small nucleolar RNA-associated protein 21